MLQQTTIDSTFTPPKCRTLLPISAKFNVLKKEEAIFKLDDKKYKRIKSLELTTLLHVFFDFLIPLDTRAGAAEKG